VNAFVKTHQAGSLAGNVLIGKYLKTREVGEEREERRGSQALLSMIDLFKNTASATSSTRC
jgi:hypothetical protein